jgi:hypothetical protein
MSKRSLLAVAVCTVAFAGVGASGALAGEVKGPPGTPCGGDTGIACEESTDSTGARDNANSNCAYSGLNDMDPDEGQTSRITQTPADAPPGSPGKGACAGGSNESRAEKGNRPTP